MSMTISFLHTFVSTYHIKINQHNSILTGLYYSKLITNRDHRYWIQALHYDDSPILSSIPGAICV